LNLLIKDGYFSYKQNNKHLQQKIDIGFNYKTLFPNTRLHTKYTTSKKKLLCRWASTIQFK